MNDYEYHEGNIFSIVAGLINVLAIYLFSWYAFLDGGTTYYAYGIPTLKNWIAMISNPGGFAASIGTELWVIIILIILVLWFLISPLLQFAGYSSSEAGILGSIPPIIVGLIFLFYSLNVISTDFSGIMSVFWEAGAIVEGIIPLHLAFVGIPGAVGMYLMIIGGFVGLIGSI
jgi:hypothetical protein